MKGKRHLLRGRKGAPRVREGRSGHLLAEGKGHLLCGGQGHVLYDGIGGTSLRRERGTSCAEGKGHIPCGRSRGHLVWEGEGVLCGGQCVEM